MLNIQDLGSAGHDGFDDLGQKNQIMYVRGGHGVALEERNWGAIVAFIFNGEVVKPKPLLVEERALWVVVLGSIAPILWLSIFAFLIFGGYSVVTTPWHEWVKTACIIGYFMLIWKILTRVSMQNFL